jgi:colanic acid biosynthesis glycosyl transferase WcaI
MGTVGALSGKGSNAPVKSFNGLLSPGMCRVILSGDGCTGGKNRLDIVFLLAGSGASREALLEQARVNDLKNVIFLPRQAKPAMPALWSVCDVSLITLRDDPLFSTVIPSKIFESMGMGLPIILSLPEGEASQIIRDTGSGLVISPEDPAQLARVLTRLADRADERNALKTASASAAADYSRDTQAAAMLRCLETLRFGSPGI